MSDKIRGFLYLNDLYLLSSSWARVLLISLRCACGQMTTPAILLSKSFPVINAEIGKTRGLWRRD